MSGQKQGHHVSSDDNNNNVITNEMALCCGRKPCLGVRRIGFKSAQTHQSPLWISDSSTIKWGKGR